MDLQLRGKKALVTASTSGIGHGIAKSLLEEGAHVTINGSNEEKTKETLATLKKNYEHVAGVTADLSKADGCSKLIKKVNGPIDILINNFGIFETVDFFETTDQLWTNIFECNVLSGIRLSRHYLQSMLLRGWGRLIFISSESALNIPEDMIHYGVTKTAQLSLMRGLAKLTKGSEVTVNAILPGPTKTTGVVEFLHKIAQNKGIDEQELENNFVEENRSGSLIQRFAKVEEIGYITSFLCSPLAPLTNGSAVKAEGGIVDQIM